MEEMDSVRTDNHNHIHNHIHNHNHHHHAGDSDSDRALSLWAPILLGMMSNPRRSRRFRQIESDDNNENDNEGGESELDRELESIMRRRRRSSATILQLLQGIRAGMITESDTGNNNGNGNGNSNSNGDREDGENNNRERVILINPFNQTIIVQGGGGGGGGGGNLFDSGGLSQNHPIGSLGDYFVGPGLELLLQHLAENDPNRYGTPPAQKEAVEAMPTVIIEEDSVQCSVCLEDFEVGNEAKEMPCKHRFHGECIFPWLELHSSCPVCRYQMPSDESKLEHEHNTNGPEPEHGNGEDGDTEGTNARRFPVTLPWPFNSLFSSTSGAQITNPPLIISASDQSGLGSGSESGPRVTEFGEGESESGQREDGH